MAGERGRGGRVWLGRGGRGMRWGIIGMGIGVKDGGGDANADGMGMGVGGGVLVAV